MCLLETSHLGDPGCTLFSRRNRSTHGRSRKQRDHREALLRDDSQKSRPTPLCEKLQPQQAQIGNTHVGVLYSDRSKLPKA